MVAALGATAVVVAAELARPFPLKLVVDRLLRAHGGEKFAVQRGDWALLAAVAVLAISIALLDGLASSFAAKRLRRTGDLVVRDLRAAIYSHLQRLTLAFRERRQTTDLAARVTGDVNAVGAVFREALRPLATSVLLLAGMLVVSIWLDPILGIVAFAVTPLLAWLTSRAHRERSTSTGTELDLTGAMTTAVVLVLGVFRVAAGALTPGGPVVGFAIATAALKSGAGAPHIIAYTIAWALFALPRVITFEIAAMPARVVWLRVTVSLPLPFLAAWAAMLTGRP